uniref:Uncharacterized protein n=1 Tax=Spongospora subterranea TaxID=70186 RepID=A0A0H5RDJ8_9EUKA|eukprot:CRZ12300.1 hypothetical protein [Spongospora subterranea]
MRFIWPFMCPRLHPRPRHNRSDTSSPIFRPSKPKIETGSALTSLRSSFLTQIGLISDQERHRVQDLIAYRLADLAQDVDKSLRVHRPRLIRLGENALHNNVGESHPKLP